MIGQVVHVRGSAVCSRVSERCRILEIDDRKAYVDPLPDGTVVVNNSPETVKIRVRRIDTRVEFEVTAADVVNIELTPNVHFELPSDPSERRVRVHGVAGSCGGPPA